MASRRGVNVATVTASSTTRQSRKHNMQRQFLIQVTCKDFDVYQLRAELEGFVRCWLRGQAAVVVQVYGDCECDRGGSSTPAPGCPVHGDEAFCPLCRQNLP